MIIPGVGVSTPPSIVSPEETRQLYIECARTNELYPQTSVIMGRIRGGEGRWKGGARRGKGGGRGGS